MTNSYIIYPDKGAGCFIIDAGFEPGPMITEINDLDLKPELLILTHAHLDHIAGAGEIKKAFPDIRIAVAVQEADFLSDPGLNLSAQMGMDITAPPADFLLSDGQKLQLEGFDFTVIHTPGHSPGGICLYQAESALLIAGDTLFAGSVGRYDFPTSDGEALMRSIKEKLMILPDNTAVYPGHGGSSTIGDEKRNNPFLKK